MAICAVVEDNGNIEVVPYSMVTTPQMISPLYGVDNRAAEIPGKYASARHITVDNGVFGPGEGDKLGASVQTRLAGINSLEDAARILGGDHTVTIVNGSLRDKSFQGMSSVAPGPILQLVMAGR